MTLFLKKTALGLYIQSAGINSRAARISGINSALICFLCYVICGVCAGIAGMVASSRIYSADSNNIGLNYELDAILAVALGGNSLGGGKFNLAGAVIGTAVGFAVPYMHSKYFYSKFERKSKTANAALTPAGFSFSYNF